MDLSIVTVSYNTKEYLLGCLSAIYRRPPGVDFEVIVVDNVSRDGSVEAVRAAFPQAKVIANSRNAGLAGGCNLGFHASSGRYVLLLNSDTEVGEGALLELVRFADAHPEASAFTCKLLNPDGTLQHSCFRFPSLRMAFYGFFDVVPMDSVANGRYPEALYEQVYEPEHILGACLMLRRHVYSRFGGLDEGFFMYFEETDLCYRLHKAGVKSLYDPAASVVHYGGRSTSQAREAMSAAFYRSQARFYRKHYGPGRLVALKLIVVAGLLYWTARSLWSLVRGRTTWATLRARLASYVQILLA